MLLCTWSVIAPGLAYRRWRYRILEEQIELRRGIIIHTTTRVPLSRIQHIDIDRGPIERAFKLATIVIHTAGTHGSVVRLPGLGPRRAVRLRNLLVDVRGEDAV